MEYKHISIQYISYLNRMFLKALQNEFNCSSARVGKPIMRLNRKLAWSPPGDALRQRERKNVWIRTIGDRRHAQTLCVCV